MIRVLACAAPTFLISLSVASAQEFSVSPPLHSPLSREIPLENLPGEIQSAQNDEREIQLRASKPDFSARQTAPVVSLTRPPDGFYQTPDEIEPFLFALAKARPDRVRLWELGRSARGRTIWGLEIRPDSKTPSSRVKRLFVVCRQHGNEPEATASGTRLISQFLNPTSQKSKNLARKTALFIVPIANPDGAAIYARRNGANVDMNRDWGRNRAPEVAALTKMIRLWKPHLLVDNHQWLPDNHMPPPMAEASGPALSRQTARLMSQNNARRGHSLASRSRWGLDTLCHRFWGQRFKIPAILLETRHRPGVPGARDKAINQALTALWSAVETVAR